MADSGITKKALAAAMKQLMEERQFSKISVSDICGMCDMNRKSFYYHFRDKYDLVNWIYYTEFAETVVDKQYADGWELLEDICGYFYSNRRFYKNALSVTGQDSFGEYFAELLKPLISEYLGGAIPDLRSGGLLTVILADAYIAAIRRWLSFSPEVDGAEFVSLIRRAALR